MKCAGIKQLLSEYIDGVLDAQTKEHLEEHISTCANCRQELQELKALVKDLGSLKYTKAPDDFIDRLHERIEPSFSLSKIMKTLFVPMRIKIPIQLVTVTATAVLVFSVINLQQPVMQLSDAPMVLEKEEVKQEVIKEPVKPTPGRKIFVQKPASTKTVAHKKQKPTKAKDIALKGLKMEKATDKKAFVRTMQKEKRTIELALVLKTGELGKANLQFAPKEKALSPERVEALDEESKAYLGSSSRSRIAGKVVAKEEVVADAAKKDKKAETPLPAQPAELKEKAGEPELDVDKITEKLKKLVKDLNGEIKSIEYDNQQGHPIFLTAEIPADKYTVFYGGLKEMGALHGPAPAVNEKKKEMIRIRLVINL